MWANKLLIVFLGVIFYFIIGQSMGQSPADHCEPEDSSAGEVSADWSQYITLMRSQIERLRALGVDLQEVPFTTNDLASSDRASDVGSEERAVSSVQEVDNHSWSGEDVGGEQECTFISIARDLAVFICFIGAIFWLYPVTIEIKPIGSPPY